MAVIALVASDIGLSGKADVRPMAFVAGVAVTAGQAVCFDLGLNDSRVYPCDTDDADRRGFIGIALDGVSAGQPTRVIMPGDGVVTGFTLTPSSVEAHRPGKYVYTGATAGAMYTEDDATVTGAIPVGIILPMAGSTTKLGIAPIHADTTITTNPSTTPGVTVTDGDPTADDDVDLGYYPGDIWINSTDAGVFVLIDNSDGAADWDELAKA